MEPSGGNKPARLLGLGNEILADDAFGILVARAVERRGTGAAIVCSSGAGFELLDHVLGADYLVVVDTVITGAAAPGTIHVFHEEESSLPAVAPHFMGLWQVLAVARRLGLPVPSEVVIVAVEAADCTTVGGRMDPAVESSIPGAVVLVEKLLLFPLSSSARAG